MNRRKFFKLSIGGIAAGAAVRTWPFRVFSFPSEVVIAQPARQLDFLCDFVKGTAVRTTKVLTNGIWVPQAVTTVKVGKVGCNVLLPWKLTAKC